MVQRQASAGQAADVQTAETDASREAICWVDGGMPQEGAGRLGNRDRGRLVGDSQPAVCPGVDHVGGCYLHQKPHQDPAVGSWVGTGGTC